MIGNQVFINLYLFELLKKNDMKYLKSSSVLVILISLIINSPLVAHEGHGNYQQSLLHYYYYADHLISIVLVIVAVVLLAKAYKNVKA